MHDKLQLLNDGLSLYLSGQITLEDVEDRYTSPIIADDHYDELDTKVADIVYTVDMWDINKLTSDDVKQLNTELSTYLDEAH